MAAIEEMPYLVGDPAEIVVGVDFSITGAIGGYLLAFFSEDDASLLIDALLGIPGGAITELDEMALSALGEAGNIIVSSFLSSLEDLCALDVMPSPPAVAVEMAGAILTSAVLPLVEEGGQVMLVEAEIVPVGEATRQSAACRILFLPTTTSWPILHQAFNTRRPQTGNMSQ